MDQSDLRFLDPAMTLVLPITKKVFEKRVPGFRVEFTAGKEWFKDSTYSLNHSGNGVDTRTRTLPATELPPFPNILLMICNMH